MFCLVLLDDSCLVCGLGFVELLGFSLVAFCLLLCCCYVCLFHCLWGYFCLVRFCVFVDCDFVLRLANERFVCLGFAFSLCMLVLLLICYLG